MSELTFEADLDAPPETVWRALSEPDLRAEWLGPEAAEALEPVEVAGAKRLRFRDRRDGSLVTFEVGRGDAGAHLTIIHVPASAEVIAFPASAPARWRMAA